MTLTKLRLLELQSERRVTMKRLSEAASAEERTLHRLHLRDIESRIRELEERFALDRQEQ